MKLTIVIATVALATGLVGCASTYPSPGSGRPGGPGPSRMGGPSRGIGAAPPDVSSLYLKQGLMAASSPVPFVGRMAFFAGPTPDSTLALMTISMPTTALEFAREGDRYRAGYAVVADLRTATGTARRVVDAIEAVRVIAWSETQRHEESVIFQRYFLVRPGTYQMSVSVRDQGQARASVYEKEIIIPNAQQQGISTALVIHEAEQRSALMSPPKVVASPRSSGIFGRDSTIEAYVETYGQGRGGMIHYAVVNEAGSPLLEDSTALNSTDAVSSAVLRIPVTSVGIGVGRLRVWSPGARDTVNTPLFVGFGDNLPIASFTDMLNYLRCYVKPERLNALRSAPEGQKPLLWGNLLRDTDPLADTPQHEGLLAYFGRIRYANEQFRGEAMEGWLTDRGQVWATLGPPDQLSSAGTTQIMGRTARSLIWEYQKHNLRLFFQERSGLGRWELDPSSRSEFNAAAMKERVG